MALSENCILVFHPQFWRLRQGARHHLVTFARQPSRSVIS
jgi:hypothetical protein